MNRWLALAFVVSSPVAFAQMTPGGGLGPGGGTMPGEEEQKPEGVAEKAPKEAAQLPTPPVLPPYPGQARKKLELLELDGYFRFRTDWFKNFNLGFHDLGSGTPFREPSSCLKDSVQMGSCSDTINSANMRLRLEPTLNLSEKVALKTQIDVLDNVVLGSTPDGVFYDGTSAPDNIPASAFSGGQAPPEAGRNYVYDSIRAKRAWAEVMTPLGLLEFGRMPSHWGLGILANSGSEDPFHGTTCLDCDYGDSADRLIFGTKIPGTELRAAIGYDWAASGPVAAQSDIWRNRSDGQPWDLDDADDVRQWVFVLTKLDSPTNFKEQVDQGKLAFNYGAYVVNRKQDLDSRGVMLSSTDAEKKLSTRGASAWIPDVYFHLGYGKFSLEGEAVAVWGDINDLSDISTGAVDWKVRQFGGVGKLDYLLMDDALDLGLEIGYASGDQWDATVPGRVNVHDTVTVPTPAQIGEVGSDDTIENFRFDFDYHVDLILFRELLGAVTNATYVKPKLTYNFTHSLVFTSQAIVSFANVPVATPGNGRMYGVEVDGDLGYRNVEEGFFAGVSYGILFPLGAMDHPEALFPAAGESGAATTAQTFQTRLVLKF